MATETLERRFAAIGARVKVVKGPRPRLYPWLPTGLLDVAVDTRGEYFQLRGWPGIAVSVLDQDRDDRCLLLFVRVGRERSRFLCGFDERHWFVAALPEAAGGIGSIEAAKAALQPELVRQAVARRRPKDRFARRNVAYIRQGEWFFLPRWSLEVDERSVRHDLPLRRAEGKPHVLELAYVHVDGQLFARGAVRHPDHATVALHGWHRVLGNTETKARAWRHIGAD
jgi:hypothetical protein